jgi:hypothetical protein
MARSLLLLIIVMNVNENSVLDLVTDAVCKLYEYLAPPVSFGLYAGAELLFLYGLYRVYLDSHVSRFFH